MKSQVGMSLFIQGRVKSEERIAGREGGQDDQRLGGNRGVVEREEGDLGSMLFEKFMWG